MTTPPFSNFSARVLVIETDARTRERVHEALLMESWNVLSAGSGEEAMRLLSREAFDLLVLDGTLPDHDGVELLKKIRSGGNHAATLLLSVRDTVEDRIVGFESGADDYLGKPFALRELVVRCRALLRRHARASDPLFRCEDLELDTRARTVRRSGEEVSLSPQDFVILEYLIRYQGQTVTREMLQREVWKQNQRFTALDNVIDVQMARLRRKLEGRGGTKLIYTVRGLGYRLGKKTE